MSLQKDNSSDDGLQGKVQITKELIALMLMLAEFRQQRGTNGKSANLALAWIYRVI